MTEPTAYRFERFAVLPQTRQLLADGRPVKLGARAFDLLLALIERRERIVPRGELFDLVWPGRIVEDQNLHVQMVALRKALGSHAIVTVPGLGYRFCLPLSGDTAPAAAPVAAPPQAPTHLLYGRDADMEQVARLLVAHRNVCIVGPGGIGKTRLAQAVLAQAAAHWTDGGCFVDLATLADGALLAAAVARALALSGAERSDDDLAAALRGSALLLVLDNCEHLLEAAAAFVERVQARAPGVSVLTTSREPLRAAGEATHRLSPLALPPQGAADADRYAAVALFGARAQSADARFKLTQDNADAVARICRSLDGLPLAIELAAARVRLLGVEGVHARLAEPLGLLSGGDRRAPVRQRTLRNTLQWSHDLLDAPERTVLRRLGVFAGAFTPETAQALAADEQLDAWAVLDALGALADKSLLQVDNEDDGTARLRLLESTRAFALERLDEAAESERMRVRHRHAVCQQFERADARVLVEPGLPWIRRALAELDDWREALHSACAAPEPPVALRLAVAAAPLLAMAGLGAEAARALQRVQPWLAQHADAGLQGRFALATAELASDLVVSDKDAIAAARRAADALRDADHARWRYRALFVLAALADHVGDRETMKVAESELWAMETPDSPQLLARLGVQRRARGMQLDGRDAEARDLLAAEVERLRRLGDLRAAWLMAHWLAMAELALGRTNAALRQLGEVASEIGQRGLQREFWQTFSLLAIVAVEHGDPRVAAAAMREALPLLRLQAAVPWVGDHLAALPLLAGDPVAAARVHGWLDARTAERGLSRTAITQRARERLQAALHDRLGAVALQRHRAEGAALDESEMIALLPT